ncbi:MAG: hypothetical protein ACR2OH_13325 [Microthrixaceae bacterium]
MATLFRREPGVARKPLVARKGIGALLAAAMAAMSLLAASCTQAINTAGDVVDPGVSNAQSAPPPPPCTVASAGSCALPYPSDEFTVLDPASPTGKRVVMPEEVVEARALDKLGPGASIDDAFGAADGFSAVGPVVFELDQRVGAESIPADGGAVVAVYDAQTGERQAIRAELWPEAAWRGAPGTIVMAWPVTRWEYGRTYVARMSRVPGLLARSPTPPAALVRGDGHPGGLVERLAAIDGSEVAGLLSATEFTVRSRENSIGGLETMAFVACADDHPVRKLESHPPAFFSHGSAIVTGEVRITDFRDGDGVVHPDSPPSHSWIPFVLAVPERPAGAAGAPVAVYGHGLLVNKETMLVVASTNAAKAVATIGIDVPNQGSRQAGQGGYLLDLTTPRHLGRVVGLIPQGIVDHVSLVKAIGTHLAEIDLAPWNAFGQPGDGMPDIDSSVLLYEGTSMGSVLGVAEFALNPELGGAFLQVPGVGIVDIITHSMLWPVFSSIVPANATAGDAAALIGAASMLLDMGDATHLLDGLADSQRAVIAQVGVGDAIVPDFSSHRLRTLLRLPELETTPWDTGNGVAQRAVIGANGRGAIDVWPQDASAETFGFMGHLTFDEPIAINLLSDWLDNRLSAAGVAPAN